MRSLRVTVRSLVAVLVIIAAVVAGQDAAQASTVTLYPMQDPTGLTGNSASSWVATPSIAQYSILNRIGYNEGQYLCGSDGTWGFRYGMTNPPDVGQGAYEVKINASAKMRRSSIFANPDDRIILGGYVNGSTGLGSWLYTQPPWSDTSGSNCGLTFNATNEVPDSVTYPKSSGYWTASDIDSLEVYLGREKRGSADLIKMFKASAVVSYDAYPQTINFSGRVFNNTNSITPGSNIGNYMHMAGAQPAPLATKGAAFRIRPTLYNYGPDRWSAGFGAMKLQYAKKPFGGTCEANGTWVDVQSGSGDIRLTDNPGVADNLSISLTAGEPLGGLAMQQYRDTYNGFPTISTVGQDGSGQWDFSLREAAPVPGAVYCLRLVATSGILPILTLNQFEGKPLDSSYTQVKSVGSLDGDVVDASGVSVPAPTVPFSAVNVSNKCQQTNATLGTSTQKIRVSNGIASNGWSMSVAPTGGAGSLWTAPGGKSYDFNDPSGATAGCADGGDSDTKAGQLSIKPSTAVVVPLSGCSQAGVSKGSNSAYNQGVVNAITLLSGSSGADMYCGWDLTGVGLTQTIPAATPEGSYSLDLTLTTVAS